MPPTALMLAPPDAAFALDIVVITEALDASLAPCDTSNGCAATCASSCTSEAY